MLADTVSLQASLYISANSIPTPGAVGITETGFVTMFKSILPDHQVMPAMLLTRFINLYGFMIISAIITIIAFLRADHDRKHKKPRLDKRQNCLRIKQTIEFRKKNTYTFYFEIQRPPKFWGSYSLEQLISNCFWNNLFQLFGVLLNCKNYLRRIEPLMIIRCTSLVPS